MNTTTLSGERAAAGVPRHLWLAVIVLGIGAFTIVTTELAPIGLLSPIALDLSRSEPTIGLTVTVYAWIGAAAALASTVWLGRVPRKPLLVALMLGLAVSNVAASLSQSFELLLVARVIGAIAHGLFWAMIGTLAAQIAPPGRTGLATSIVFGGVSAASVLGVPAINVIGQLEGWRAAFAGVAGLGALAAIAMAAVVPKVESDAPVGVQALKDVLGMPALRGIFAATVLAVTGHFAAFTFIEPYLVDHPSVSAAMVAVLLFVFGAAGLLGNVLTGVLVDRFLKPVVLCALAGMTLSLAGLGAFGRVLDTVPTTLLLVVWGASIAAIFVGLQTWILRTAGRAALPASAIYVAIFNASIGLGATLGAAILARAGLEGLMIAACLASVLALVPAARLPRPARADG